MRIALAIILLALAAFAAWGQSIRQQTEGWCSPAVADVKGNVQIVCQGVDPKALKRLNELLDKKDLELDQKIKDADEWAKRYRDLSARLAATNDDSQLSQQAKALIQEGKFDEAGELLDRLIAKHEAQVDQLAANRFNRAELFSLQFQHARALPHYERAYQYRPDNPEYGYRYAATLYNQISLDRARDVLLGVLKLNRDLAARNPDAYRPTVAMTLNDLGIVYSDTERWAEAEGAYKEALGIYRDLAVRNEAYRAEEAMALNNLAILYTYTQRRSEAEGAYKEALAIDRDLAAKKPEAYRHRVSTILNNLGILYRDMHRPAEAEGAYTEALGIRRDLAGRDPAAYRLYVADTLYNLANLYGDTQRPVQAEGAFKDALAIYRDPAARNSEINRERVALTLATLASLYAQNAALHKDSQRLAEAEALLVEALDLFRVLATKVPDRYQPKIDAASALLAQVRAAKK